MTATPKVTEPSLTRFAADLLCVDPAQVWQVWPHARDFIRRALARTGLSEFAAVEAEVLSGLQLLWLASDGRRIEAAATTQLTTVSGRKICVLVACGGENRTRWLPLLEGIEDYARAEGCTRMQVIGRKGWQRVLRDYRARYVILQKELN